MPAPRKPPLPTEAELEKAFVRQGLAMLGPADRRQAMKVRIAPDDPLATVVREVGF